MDYIAVALFAFFVGMMTMSLFAMSGSQEQARVFREAWIAQEEVIDALKKLSGLRQEENDALHEVNRNLCARLDKRTVTLHDETGMAVEMPVEDVA